MHDGNTNTFIRYINSIENIPEVIHIYILHQMSLGEKKNINSLWKKKKIKNRKNLEKKIQGTLFPLQFSFLSDFQIKIKKVHIYFFN